MVTFGQRKTDFPLKKVCLRIVTFSITLVWVYINIWGISFGQNSGPPRKTTSFTLHPPHFTRRLACRHGSSHSNTELPLIAVNHISTLLPAWLPQCSTNQSPSHLAAKVTSIPPCLTPTQSPVIVMLSRGRQPLMILRLKHNSRNYLLRIEERQSHRLLKRWIDRCISYQMRVTRRWTVHIEMQQQRQQTTSAQCGHKYSPRPPQAQHLHRRPICLPSNKIYMV